MQVKFIRLVACCVALAAFGVLAAQAQDSAQQPGEVSMWRAKRMLTAAGKYVYLGHLGAVGVHYYSFQTSTLQILSSELKFEVKNQKGQIKQFSIALKELHIFSPNCNEDHCFLNGGFLYDTAEKKDYGVYFNSQNSAEVRPTCNGAEDPRACMNACNLFATALNGLRAYALAHPNATASEDFHQLATAWRAQVTKPSVPEGARVYRLAAEDAIERKQPFEALNYYELGVQANPTWALGWYNAALLGAEVGDFAAAAEHMQNYLELLPNAEDAQSARDHIDLWKYKAGH